MQALKTIGVLGLAFWVVGCAAVPLTVEQSSAIRGAAISTLNANAKVDVSTERGTDREALLVISARLLDGFSAEETDPAVKAQYRDIPGLTHAVQTRSAQILRAVDASATLPEVDRVMIETRHGVRLVRPGQVYGGSDISRVLYAVSVAKSDLLENDLASMSDEEISTLWRVEQNILPRLRMQRPTYEDGFEEAKQPTHQANAKRTDSLENFPLP